VSLEQKLTKTFSPTFLKVEDDSHRHVGHGDYQAGGGTHWTVTLVSEAFTNLPRLKRHQAVYACLEEELKNGVHALCLKLLSPVEVSGESTSTGDADGEEYPS
jgi:BolA family transcriptional regulator, general stress-responsive regulator